MADLVEACSSYGWEPAADSLVAYHRRRADRRAALTEAWHAFQHGYYDAPRTHSGGRIIGGITCRPQLDAMAEILAQAHVTPARPWPHIMVSLDHSCCGTQPHG